MAKSALKLPTAKAISIWQPWATLIVTGVKDIENRSWQTHYRGPLLIHAPKMKQYFYDDCAWIEETLGIKVPPRKELPFGAIIGHAELIDCIYSEKGDDKWGQPGCYHWILQNPRSLPRPIPYRGHQGFFSVKL